jgi:outer membrane protein assembly factor BamD (BamD/ComL family)
LSQEERQNALNELLDKYPDSYAAAKAVSSKALESVMRNNIGAAEEYYDMLVDVQAKKTDRVVLDNGFEAVPTVEHTLAYAYYRSGRTEDVKTMVKSLEENYSDSLYRVRSRGGPSIITGEEAIDRIYRITGIGNTAEGNP